MRVVGFTTSFTTFRNMPIFGSVKFKLSFAEDKGFPATFANDVKFFHSKRVI